MLFGTAAIAYHHLSMQWQCVANTIPYHCLLDRPSFEPKQGLSVRCLKYAFLKAGFNSADVGGFGSLAQIADAA